MSGPCCTAASRRSSGRRSCGRRRSTRRAIRSGPSWTKSATSLPSPSSPTPRPSPAPGSRWAWVVGLVVTLALLAWALHGVDGRQLVGLMTLAIASPAFPGHARIGTTSVSGLATGAAVFFGAVLVVAVLVVHRPAPWLALLRRVTHALLPARFAGRLTQVAEGLVAGLEVLKSPTRFVGVVAWSLLQWLVNAAAFAVCFRAFGLPVPPEGAFLLQGIIGFGVALPASPGFVGVFEAATRVTLAIYGIDATRAVSYAVAYHVSTFVPITLLGLYSLSRLQLHLAELRTAGDAPAQTGGSVDHVKHTPR